MKRKALLKTEPRPVPDKDSGYAVIASQTIFMNGHDVLNIDIFYKEELKGRYFADTSEMKYTAFIDGEWHEMVLGNCARLCMGLPPNSSFYVYYDTSYDWASDEDKKRALRYLDTYSVDTFECAVNYKKRKNAAEKKKRRIDDLMDAIPAVPDEVENWVKDMVFPDNFLFIQKGKKRTDYGCTACGAKSWKLKGWKHGETTNCPKCEKNVKVISRQQERKRCEHIVFLQPHGNEWVERQFKAECIWKSGEKEIILYEQLRAVIPKGKTWGKVYYGLQQLADEFMQEFWDKNPENKKFVSSYLYPGNLNEVLPYGNLEKSGMDFMAKKLQKFNVNKYITSFHERPWTEYFAKMGLTKMIADIVDKYGWWGNPSSLNTKGKNAKEILQINGDRVNRLKRMNGGLAMLEWLQYEQKHCIKISKESMEWLNEKDLSVTECERILEELKSVNRMVNYMKKQKIAPNRLAIVWRDYLRMAQNEGMDTTDDIVRMPKDLKRRHDQLVELANARRDAERLEKEREKYAALDKKILMHLSETVQYFWEDEKYMIVPAGKCEELIEEGRALHHCVGASDTYMNRMAEGTSWICFLRKKKELKKPYYTIEIDMKTDKVRQYYSEFDRKPDATTVNGILARWKNSIKKKRQQTEVKVPLAV